MMNSWRLVVQNLLVRQGTVKVYSKKMEGNSDYDIKNNVGVSLNFQTQRWVKYSNGWSRRIDGDRSFSGACSVPISESTKVTVYVNNSKYPRACVSDVFLWQLGSAAEVWVRDNIRFSFLFLKNEKEEMYRFPDVCSQTELGRDGNICYDRSRVHVGAFWHSHGDTG